jgi:hypothetical protein
MFEAGVPTRQFAKYDSSTMLEQKNREHGVEETGLSHGLGEKEGLEQEKVEYSHVE